MHHPAHLRQREVAVTAPRGSRSGDGVALVRLRAVRRGAPPEGLSLYLPDLALSVVRIPHGVLRVHAELAHQRRPAWDLVPRHLPGGGIELDQVVRGRVELAEPDVPGRVHLDRVRLAAGATRRVVLPERLSARVEARHLARAVVAHPDPSAAVDGEPPDAGVRRRGRDRKSTRLNSSHITISYAV